MTLIKLLLHTFLVCLLIIPAACTTEFNHLYEKTTKKEFLDVIQDAEFAITENNFRITNRLHIGDAIQKRGNTNFPQNEVILFCNLSIAEKMLLIEPHYINYCPYKITVTESNDEIVIAAHLLPTRTNNKQMDELSKNINKVLRSMVEYTASEDPFILDQN